VKPELQLATNVAETFEDIVEVFEWASKSFTPLGV
jgi:hypothetical protein